MPVKTLPLPTLLNEASFCRFSTRADFVVAVRQLAKVLKIMVGYGFEPQLRCSRTVMNMTCYEDVSFEQWLRSPDGKDIDENGVRRYVRSAISRVPRLEDWYTTFDENPDFDLLWRDRMLYVNAERSLPAFVVAVSFGLPTVALGSAAFSQDASQAVTVRELDGEVIRDRQLCVYSVADEAQVAAIHERLCDLISEFVVDEKDFARVRGSMFPDISFSREVECSLEKHLIPFQSMPVLAALIRLQRAFKDMCGRNVCFEDAYGRIRTLAMNESLSVRQEKPDTRRFTWDDKCRHCYPHVKIGNHFRIHFLPSKEEGKVYVGYMGPHLPL